MEKLIIYFLSLTLLVGCLRLPSAKQTEAEKKTAQIEQKIASADSAKLDAARNYNYGVQYSLGLEPDPSKFVLVAADLNNKSLIILGAPSLKNATEFKQIVDGLVSTNTVEIKRAEAALKIKDSEVMKLQGELVTLNSKLEKQEDKNLTLARENATLANVWFRWKRLFLWIIWIIGGFILLRIVCAVIPPPYNSVGFIIDYIAGGLFRIVKFMLPKATVTAKVVGVEVETALTHVVQSIQTVKETDPATYAKLRPILKENTSQETSRPIIEEIVNEIKKPIEIEPPDRAMEAKKTLNLV